MGYITTAGKRHLMYKFYFHNFGIIGWFFLIVFVQDRKNIRQK